MHLSIADYVLEFIAPTLQLGVLIAMCRRGLHRDYPFFFNYTILQIVSVPVLAAIRLFSYTAYYYGYYVVLGLSILISYAVFCLKKKNAFRPYEALRDLSVILFLWSALVVFLVGVMWAINTAQAANKDVMMDVILLADRSLRLMQCGLVFFLLLFSEYLGIPHRSMLFGISLGFGFFAAVNMLVATGASQHSFLSSAMLSRLNSCAYIMAVVIWFRFALAAAPSRSKVAEQSLVRSQDWNSALQEVRVSPADSLLDSMDRTVERLLYPQEEAKVKVSSGHV